MNRRRRVPISKTLIGAGVSAALAVAIPQAIGQEAEPSFPIQSPADARTHGLEDLRTAVQQDGGVPAPNLSEYLNPGQQQTLAALGKMLFWDQSLGSNGQACASCHFQAGADMRSNGVVSPGLLRVKNQRNGDIRGYDGAGRASSDDFNSASAGGSVSSGSFPLTKNPGQLDDQGGGVIGPGAGNSDDQISSPGVTFKRFDATVPQQALDECTDLDDPVFRTVHGNVRRVPPRNTPSAINAVFNFFNFWDGRAQPEFNGQNPFGDIDGNARVLKNQGGEIVPVRISLKNSSLASQATGPVLSDFEESCGDGANGNARTWPEVGKKLLRRNPGGARLQALDGQDIDRRDSLIGRYSRGSGSGANTTYRELVKRVFKPTWWRSNERRILLGRAGAVSVLDGEAHKEPVIVYPTFDTAVATPEESVDEEVVTPVNDGLEDSALTDASTLIQESPRFTLMEANFSLFFGLAVQAYEATLVSDDSPFDQWMRSGNFNAKFGADELAGLNVFVGNGKCVNCHSGPEMTSASVRNAQKGKNIIEAMTMGDNRNALYDNGFYNIGVTPTVWDLGRGARTPFGTPLASSRQFLFEKVLGQNIPHRIIGDNGVPAVGEEGGAVCTDTNGDGFCSGDGGEAINAEFQRAAVDGAFKTPGLRNVELTGPYFHNGEASTLAQVVELYDNGGHFCDFNIADLDPDITSLGLTATEKRNLVKFMVALTDERVRRERAPFDHPSATIPASGAVDGVIRLPAVGSRGNRRALSTFLNLNPQDVGGFPVSFQCSPF